MYDKDHQSLTWLKCDVDTQNKDYVDLLDEKLLTGMDILFWESLSCNQLDHARSDQHVTAVSHLCTVQAKAWQEPVVSYAPIAHLLLMPEESKRERMRCKFDICYVNGIRGCHL